MSFGLDSLLTEKEMTTPRTPPELADWVEEKLRLFERHKEAERSVLLREGAFKKFYEELYPLYHLANRLYSGRSDILCMLNLGGEDFDAVIVDNSICPPSELKIEITCAIDGYDDVLRWEYFLRHGHVNYFGRLACSGTKKTGHQIQVENEAVSHDDLLKRVFSLITKAIERKSDRRHQYKKYGPGHALVVVFFDQCGFMSGEDIAAIKHHVETSLLSIPLSFTKLYILGGSGKTFLDFDLKGFFR